MKREPAMIGIGIDTGGTYTDAVVIDTRTHEVLAKCKQLTTKRDLSIGIGNALDQLPGELVSRTELIALSTTLATNACVEDKGGNAKLVLLGSTEEILRRVNARERYGLEYDKVLALDTRGSFDGSVVDEPDWELMMDEHEAFFADAEALAIAELNALRNGAVVERNGSEFLLGHTNLPVVTATSIAAELNVMERGATALLNARLLPVIEQFLIAIEKAMTARGLDIPVMIVRSDGSFMSQQLAKTRPVETILSGPASSVAGARNLAESRNCLIIDMGGTTTDVAIIEDDDPVMTDGIRIGGWRTQIQGVLIDTIGLGGDSWVRLGNNADITLSPRRVTPLCIAASLWPEVTEKLEKLVAADHATKIPLHEFLYLVRRPGDLESCSSSEKRILELVADGPLSLADPRFDYFMMDTERLEREGIVMRIGMTPTDAMHIKGDFDGHDARASYLAAQYFMMAEDSVTLGRAEDSGLPMDERIQAFADRIYDLVERKLFHQLVRLGFQHRFPKRFADGLDAQMDAIVGDAWDSFRSGAGTPQFLQVGIGFSSDLVGIGAPTHVFLPTVAEALGTRCITPEDAEVANAVGAILTSIDVEAQANVQPVRGEFGVVLGYQVHSIEVHLPFEELADAMTAAEEEARRLAEKEARRRGARGVLDIEVRRTDDTLHSGEGVDLTYGWSFIARARTVEVM